MGVEFMKRVRRRAAKCVLEPENTTGMKHCKKEMCFKQSDHREADNGSTNSLLNDRFGYLGNRAACWRSALPHCFDRKMHLGG